MTRRAASQSAARFPAAYRIRNTRDFATAFETGTRRSDAMFTVIFRYNALAWSRLGLAVSRRYSPRATDRNRLKRLVREAFRYHAVDLAGIDVIVRPKPEALTADDDILRASLIRLWSRLPRPAPPNRPVGNDRTSRRAD